MGAILCVIAVVAVVLPGMGYVRAATDGVLLEGPQHVQLDPDRTYGIYVNDADNSGYTETCSVVDLDGKTIAMDDPGWDISFSETEMLDFVFRPPSRELTVECSVPGEQVTLRPVPNHTAMLMGLLVGVISILLGGAMVVAWAVTRRAGPRDTSSAR